MYSLNRYDVNCHNRKCVRADAKITAHAVHGIGTCDACPVTKTTADGTPTISTIAAKIAKTRRASGRRRHNSPRLGIRIIRRRHHTSLTNEVSEHLPPFVKSIGNSPEHAFNGTPESLGLEKHSRVCTQRTGNTGARSRNTGPRGLVNRNPKTTELALASPGLPAGMVDCLETIATDIHQIAV